MATIIFVDSDSKWIANYKRMLTPFEKEFHCVYFQHSEEAMEYVSTYPTAVLVSELDMPVMSGRELFEMIDLLSPTTVKIGITQVRNVADTLDILNQIKIYKLILKPFFVAEDLIVPIRAALDYQKGSVQEDETYQRAERKLQELNQQTEELQKKLSGKKQGNDRILNAMLGVIDGNLSLPVAEFDADRKETVRDFCQELLQEFFQYYMYEKKNLIFYLSHLKNRFHHAGKSHIFEIKSKVGEEVPITVMNRIAYVTFLTGFLCETCLENYYIGNVLEAEGSRYVLHIWYDWDGGNKSKNLEPGMLKLLSNIIGELQCALSDHMAVEKEGNMRKLKLYFQREEGQR